MPDIREILREGADVEPGLPDVPQLLRRGQAAARRRTAVLAAAAAACVAGAVGLGALVPSINETPDRVPQSAPAPRPLPAAGPLAAGVYDASTVGLDLSFTVPGPGWTLTTVQTGWIGLRHGRSSVVVQEWDAVVDPDADPVGPGDTEPVPADLVAWLTGHPALDVDGVTRVLLGQKTWTALELTVERPLSTTPAECNTLPCVLLAVAGDEPAEFLARDRARVLVSPEVAGGAPVVVLTWPKGQTGPDSAAEALISSLDPP